MVTVIISTRLLRGHKKLSDNLPLAAHSLYLGAIAVLVEAAAPVSVAGLVWAIITVIPTTPQTVIGQAVFQALFQLSAVGSLLQNPGLLLTRRTRLWHRNLSSSVLQLEALQLIGQTVEGQSAVRFGLGR